MDESVKNFSFDLQRFVALTWNSTENALYAGTTKLLKTEGTYKSHEYYTLSGGSYTVDSDLYLDAPIVFTETATLTVNATLGTADSYTNESGTSEYYDFVVGVGKDANLTINGSGTIDGKSKYADGTNGARLGVKVTVSGDSKTEPNNATLTVNGNVKINGYDYGISGNGTRHGTIININGGEITGGTGIYHPQEGTLNIKGGTITGTAECGVEIRSGSLTVTGGTITSQATEFSSDPNGDGTTTKGAGIAVAQHTTGKTIDVQINGGNISGVYGLSITNPNTGTISSSDKGITNPGSVSVTVNDVSALSGREGAVGVDSTTSGNVTELKSLDVTKKFTYSYTNAGKDNDTSNAKAASVAVNEPGADVTGGDQETILVPSGEVNVGTNKDTYVVKSTSTTTTPKGYFTFLTGYADDSITDADKKRAVVGFVLENVGDYIEGTSTTTEALQVYYAATDVNGKTTYTAVTGSTAGSKVTVPVGKVKVELTSKGATAAANVYRLTGSAVNDSSDAGANTIITDHEITNQSGTAGIYFNSTAVKGFHFGGAGDALAGITATDLTNFTKDTLTYGSRYKGFNTLPTLGTNDKGTLTWTDEENNTFSFALTEGTDKTITLKTSDGTTKEAVKFTTGGLGGEAVLFKASATSKALVGVNIYDANGNPTTDTVQFTGLTLNSAKTKGQDLLINEGTVNVNLEKYSYIVSTSDETQTIDVSDTDNAKKDVTVTNSGVANRLKVGELDGKTVTLGSGTSKVSYIVKTTTNGGQFILDDSVGSTAPAATGYIFASDSTYTDSITVSDASVLNGNFTLYAGDTETAIDLPTITGYTGYAKIEEGGASGTYTLTVGQGAVLTLDNGQSIDLSGLKKGAEYVKVKFGADGFSTIEFDSTATNIAGKTSTATTWTDGDTIKITGAVDTSGSPVGITFGDNTSAVQIGSGEYTYRIDEAGSGGKITTSSILLSSTTPETVTSTGGAKAVYPGATTGTIIDANDAQYQYSTSQTGAYFTAASGKLNGFVFVNVEDALTVTDDLANNFSFQYYNAKSKAAAPFISKAATIPVSSSDAYTLRMTTASDSAGLAEFAIEKFDAGATVAVNNTKSFEFSAADGSLNFSAKGTTLTETGLNATTGTVTMSQTAAKLLAKGSGKDAVAFQINGEDVDINVGTVTTELVYTAGDEQSLSGLGTSVTVTDVGSLKKIYASSSTYTDKTTDTDYKFTVTSDGTETAAPYFSYADGKVTGFTFAATDDALTIQKKAGTPEGFKLYADKDDTTGFVAPVVWKDGTKTSLPDSGNFTVKKEDKTTFSLNGFSPKNYIEFEGTGIEFGTIDSSSAKIQFTTSGELNAINGITKANNSVKVSNATKPIVFNEDAKNPVEILNSTFTYTCTVANTEWLIDDIHGGAKILRVAGATSLDTAEGEDGKGTFTFGSTSKVFTVDGDNNGITFNLASGTVDVTGIAGVDTETVKGAFFETDGFSLNGSTDTKVTAAGKSTIYEFSVGRLANLQSGDAVTAAGDITSFVTGADGTFTILETPMEIKGDSSVSFGVDGTKLTTITGLSGTAIGGFSGISVNGQVIDITGAKKVNVKGTTDGTNIASIGGLSGTGIVVNKAGNAKQIGATGNGDFTFNFKGNEKFELKGNGEKQTWFTFNTKVAGISGLDSGESVKGNFANGIKFDEANTTLGITGDDTITATLVNGGLSVSDFSGGATISAVGDFTAKTDGTEGAFTDIDKKVVKVAGGSAVFTVKDGKFTAIKADDGVSLSGDLNGLVINGGSSILVLQADGNENTDLTYDSGILSGIKNGDTVVRADSASTVRTAEAGTFTFGIDGSKFTTDDESIDFALTTGTVEVTEVSGLDKGAKLSGALTSLEKVNGATFEIKNDTDFAVIGAESGISAISQLSNGAEVKNAGGASLAITDAAGKFTFKNGAFSIATDTSVEFKLKDSAATGVEKLDGVVSAQSDLFVNFTVNGQSIAISGDENDLAVTGADGKISAIANVGGAAVTITKAGGASAVLTDKAGAFNFASASQAFLTANDDTVTFTLDTTGKVTEISEISETSAVVGGTINGLKLNGSGPLGVANDADNFLSYAVAGDKTTLLNVGGTSVIVTNAAGVDEVQTDSKGKFTFENGAFAVEGDDTEVIFQMDKSAAAKVIGISGIGESGVAGVGGAINGLFLNGNGPLDIQNDEDNFLSYAVNGNATIVGLVSGTGVQINGLAGASTVQIVGDGDYTFKAFEKGKYVVTGGDSSVIFTKDSISELEGTVTGDFAAETSVNGKMIQVTGDSSVGVLGGTSGVTSISNLSNGAKVITAQDVRTALTDGDGTFTFINGEFTISGDSNGVIFQLFQLDGTANVVGVEGLDDDAVLSGALSSLTTINGVSVAIRNDNNFAVVGASSGIKAINGISNGADVVHAGGAQSAATDSSGTFLFSTAGQSFLVDGSENVKFQLDGDKVVAIDNLTGAVTSKSFGDVTAINGASFAITGDEGDLQVIGKEDATGLTEIAKVGGEIVTIESAGGASTIRTDKEGVFEFTSASQTFVTANDDTVKFTLDKDGKVTEISDISGTSAVVAGTINGLKLNGNGPLDVAGEVALAYAVSGEKTALFELGGESVVVRNAASVDIVRAYSGGTFTFADNGEIPFSIVDDDTEVIFEMDKSAAAKVVGISGLGDSGTGSIGGKLGGLTINGNGPLDITGDSDEIFGYTVGEKGAVIGGVSGTEVAINNVAGASRVDVNGNGAYTFFGEKTFAVDGIVSEVDFGITDGKVTTISDFDKGEKVTGNFEDEIKVNGQAIQVGGDSAITVEFDDILIRDLSNGATIVKADDIKEAWTDALDGEIEVTDADGHKFTVAGTDEDGVKFVLDGKGHVTGVESLGEDVVLSGALSVLDSINETTFEVKNDAEFAVVGASNGIKSITGISDGADVVHAGGAKDAQTDTAGKFVFSTGGQSFTVDGSENVRFNLTEDKVTSIENLNGSVVGNSFDGITAINGQSFAISGDDGDLKIVGTEDAQRISEIANVGGENVTIQNAGGATFVMTDKVGAINFAKSNQDFAIDGDAELTFELDDEGTVTAITGLSDGTVSGNLNGVAINDNAAIDIEGDEGTLAYTVNGTENTLDNVGGENVAINNVGGAKFVTTDKVGTFNFAENDQPFDVAGDENIRFEMDENSAAKVVGISELNDGATIGGALNELKINGGNAIDIQNDEDGYLTYEIDNGRGLVGGVKGDGVEVNSIGAASAVEINGDGDYTFGAFNKGTYAVAGDSSVIFTKDTIEDLTGKVTGDFSAATTVNGKEIQVAGDSSVGVIGVENGVEAIEKLSNGAEVLAAEDVTTATTDSEGTFKFANGEFSVAGDSAVIFQLDGKANVVGVEGLDEGATLTGKVSGLTINGQSVIILNDETFSVVGNGAGNGIKSVEGISDGADVVKAGGASNAQADSAGTFVFSTGGQSFLVEGSSSVNFVLNADKVVAIENLDGAVTSETFDDVQTVNGKTFDIVGDENDLKIFGKVDGITAFDKVGGETVSINDAGGASTIATDVAGEFTFTKAQQTFKTDDADLLFDLDANEKVLGIDLVDKSVTGNFDGVKVNDQTLEITDGDSSQKVFGNLTGVTKIAEVDSEATISNVGGASVVETKTAGKFAFNNGTFEVTGDESVQFAMKSGSAADVAGVTSFGDAGTATLSGELDGVYINETANLVDVKGDADGVMTYTLAGENAVLGNVGGSAVAINAIAGASVVEIVANGKYTFGAFDKGEYAFALNETPVKVSANAINDLSGTATGSFESETGVNGKAIQVTGDAEIAVVGGENAVSAIEKLSGGATVEKAEDVATATTDSAGTFKFANGEFSVAGDSAVTFQLDGKANVVGVNGLDEGATLTGAINGLAINGQSVNILNDETFGVIGNGADNGIKAITGLTGGASIVNAGGAETAYTDSEGEFTFTDGQKVAVYGDSSVALGLNANGTLAKVDEMSGLVDADSALLANVPVNGKLAQLEGDVDNLVVVGTTDAKGIESLVNVGPANAGELTVVDAAGASTIFTDKVGTFKFTQSGQTFTLAGDSSVVFTTDAAGKVVAVEGLNENGVITGDFAEEISVNGDKVQVTGDANGVAVAGSSEFGENGVTRISGVDAGATVAQWGNAAKVDAVGTGAFTFGSDSATAQKFTNTGDADGLFTFATSADKVTGVEDLQNGTLNFSNNVAALDVNVAQVAAQSMSFASETEINLTVADYKVNGATLSSGDGTAKITGLVDATVQADGAIYVNDGFAANGAVIDIQDNDALFGVEVASGAVTKATSVTGGDATISAADATIETDAVGAFNIGGKDYTINDDGNMTFVTDSESQLAAVSNIEGWVAAPDAKELALDVNGNAISITNSDAPVTIGTNGSVINGVNGLADGAVVAGDLADAAIRTPGTESEETPANVTINGKAYAIYGDADGVVFNGADGAITDLADEASLKVAEAGVYTVNSAVLDAKEDDIIIGRDNQTDAYIYNPENILVRANTPISDIENMTGMNMAGAASFGGPRDGIAPEPLNSAESEQLLATADLNQTAEIWLDNADDKEPQALNFSPYNYAKEVHLYEGTQVVAFNDEGGNMAHIQSEATGKKDITLGNGGDVVVMDESAALGNAVNITGGAGDDSVFVRGSANTTFDMSKGGADRVVVFGGANARATLDNYNAATDGGLKIDEGSASVISDAIDNGTLGFGDGVVSVKSAQGVSEIYVNDNQTDGTLVNLFTPSGEKQVVGFTNMTGGSVDGSAATEDLILIGNDKGQKTGSSVLVGGAGSDTIKAGGGDVISTGAGNDLVQLQDNATREGAAVVLGAGRTTLTGMNNTLAQSTGDTLSFDLSAAQKIELDENGNLVIDGNGFYAVAPADVQDGNYVTQFITDTATGTTYKAAIGGKSAVMKVTEDEDVRPNSYLGHSDGSGVDFSEYTGPVTVDLKGDIYSSNIDGAATFFNDGILTLIGGSGNSVFKGGDANETFVAGSGYGSIYGDGGHNLMVGYTGADKTGSTTFFVLGNADGAANTIRNFDFVSDDNYTDNSKITADKIEVDTVNNYVSAVSVSGSDVFFEVANRDDPEVSETVVVEGALGKDMRVGNNIAQVNTDTLVFDKFANHYMAMGKNATVYVDSSVENVNLWLDDDGTGKNFEGDIKVIDARANGASAELSGNAKDNVIYAGTGNTSLWGGGMGDDLLVGNTGKDSFYYNYGDGNDSIDGAGIGDEIILGDMTLDDIDVNVSSAGVEMRMNDGGKLTINDGSGVDFKVAGETYALNEERQFVRK